ncbi:MAG: PEP-CTERM sorting domain-containing protein [Deltaproteobacteria bacterium]|nr:PEP-CTERM sorting domain-containing protein [Deltaproteobacteria bacterium]
MRLARNIASIGLACSLALLLAGAAGAVPLSDLDDGSVPSFTSGSGLIEFGAFSASVSGALDPDLSVYEITATANGFDLTSSIRMLVNDFEVGTLTIDYDVTILVGGLELQQAHLSYATGTVEFGGALATVLEDLFDAPSGSPIAGDADLDVLTTGAAGTVRGSDTAVFVERTTLHVVKSIVLSGGAIGNEAEITSISQSFTIVPEPGTASLLVLGLLCLAARRRSLDS